MQQLVLNHQCKFKSHVMFDLQYNTYTKEWECTFYDAMDSWTEIVEYCPNCEEKLETQMLILIVLFATVSFVISVMSLFVYIGDCTTPPRERISVMQVLLRLMPLAFAFYAWYMWNKQFASPRKKQRYDGAEF